MRSHLITFPFDCIALQRYIIYILANVLRLFSQNTVSAVSLTYSICLNVCLCMFGAFYLNIGSDTLYGN